VNYLGSQQSKERCKSGKKKSQPIGGRHENDATIAYHDDGVST